MWGLLATAAVVIVLAKLARPRSEARASREERRLARLLNKKNLDLDEAEDGAVLARRFGRGEAERKFRERADDLKRRRKV